MPGLVGLVGTNGISDPLQRAVEKLNHFSAYCLTHIYRTPPVSLAQVLRQDNYLPNAWQFDIESQAGAIIYGSIFYAADSPKRLGAKDILARYLEAGFADWENLDGSFIAVILDLRQRTLAICNDRLGQLPLYYARNQRKFAFGPEIKSVLLALDLGPRLSIEGLTTFLSAGYCFGKRTLFSDVEILEPSTMLRVDLDTLELRTTRLWKIVYKNDGSLQPKAAEKQLYTAILNGHELMLSDTTAQYDLLLSGGLDSRGILGVLASLDRLPRRAVAYGVQDTLPHSDVAIARSLAGQFHVPFEFVKFDIATFLQNAEQWCYISEAANDNIGWYGESPNTQLSIYDTLVDFVLMGDECWGWQGYAYDEITARSEVLPAQLPLPLREITRHGRTDSLTEIYEAEVREIYHNYEFSDWTDLKDYLYVHGRLARFIFSLGYYRELYVQIRRPFLANAVLDVISRLPPNLRVFKNLYVSMLRRHLPEIMFCPAQSVSSFPDWPYVIRSVPELRDFFLENLSAKRIGDGPLSEVLDPQRTSSAVSSFFSAQATPTLHKPSLIPRLRRGLLLRASRYTAYRWLVGRNPGRRVFQPVSRYDLMRRLIIIQLLHSQLHRFSLNSA